MPDHRLAGPLVLAASLVMLPRPVLANRVHEIVVDVGTGEITGDGKPVQVHEEDIVSVRLTNTLPGLFTYTVTTVLRPERALPAQLGIDFGLIKPKAAASPAPPPPGPPVEERAEPTVIELYNELIAKWQEFQRVIAGKYTAATYEAALTALVKARHELLFTSKVPDDGASVAAALNKGRAVKVPEDPVIAAWEAIRRMLSIAPESTADLGPFLFTFDDREFDLLVTVAPVAGVTAAAPRTVSVPVREKYGWKWTTTTGFAFSGLRDHNWSIRTVEVTPATDGKPAVTRNAAMEEDKDRISTEPAVFIHVSPIHGSAWERLAVTTGVSVNPTNAARIYGGVSWLFGRVGALTAGVAAGRVKVLGKNVNRADLGTLDPQQARRDVFTTAAFVAFSLRFGAQ